MDMVDDQIVSRGITDDNVIKAMRAVKRELFVPKAEIPLAYKDYPLPIGHGQTISQPYIVAYMTEALSLQKSYKVLEIGTGSGYQSAILSTIVKEVYSVERINSLAVKAKENLKRAGYSNIYIKTGDGYDGWKEKAPFDSIIVTAASPVIPEPLISQLSDSGGRMIIPIGYVESYQELILLTKSGKETDIQRLLPVRFVPFISKKIY